MKRFRLERALHRALSRFARDRLESRGPSGSRAWNRARDGEGFIDGNSYGFLVNPLGVAVNGFPNRAAAKPSRGGVFRRRRRRGQPPSRMRRTLSVSAEREQQEQREHDRSR